MITRTKDEQLALVIIPVSTETTEYRGSIIHRMREHAEFHIRIRNDAALVKHEIWQRHGISPRGVFAPAKAARGFSARSVYHTDRFGSGLAPDLKRKEAHESDTRCGQIKWSAVTNALE